MDETNKEYLHSLKSIETENYIDRKFYRPLGFKIAYALRSTGITPNMITIISIIVGVGGASLFYFRDSPLWVFIGVLGMIAANVLDCVDGQLARMTGIKSKIGRILDGMAGDFWFITIYFVLSLRIYHDTGWIWIFVIASFSMLSHFVQAALTDYYKTLHLYFISPETTTEFDTPESVRTKLTTTPWGKGRLFMMLYLYYTQLQSRLTPQLRALIYEVSTSSGITSEQSALFRRGSSIVMKSVDLLTFNGRSIPLFIAVLTGHTWFYFLYEIFFLNIILGVARSQHEALCYNYLQHFRNATTTQCKDQ